MVRKAGALITGWILALIVSIVMAPFSTFFGGVVVGSLVSVVTLGLALKWSIRGMIDETIADVEDMQEQLNLDVEERQINE
jgi:hypothetical protein